MTQADLIGQAHAYTEAVNRGDWDAAVQYLSPDVLLVVGCPDRSEVHLDRPAGRWYRLARRPG